jgi:gamma-glutamylcyclotransferase (GGCT)/AIG2-like uncharacterized protein YtfP
MLFAYGTLQFPLVLQALLGRVPDLEPAVLPGWRAAALPGRLYPGLVPGGGRAPGQLLVGLTAGEWSVLDAFEGDAYDRCSLRLADGREAWVYVWRDVDDVEPHDWDADRFARESLPGYLVSSRRWRDAGS